MAASRSSSKFSLARFFGINPGNTPSKSPSKPTPRLPTSSMPKRRLSQTQSPWSTLRMMDDSDDDYSFFSRRPQPPISPLTLIAFYDGSGKDSRGRKLEEILQWDARRLESSHDYIQTLFPLPEKSGIIDRAPIIDQAVFEAFRSRSELRDNLRDAFKKMLWFYGFDLIEEGDKLTVSPGATYRAHSENWNTRFDHNHLRITRIIRCLRVLGLEKEALAFYDTISCASTVSSKSRMFWGRAAYRQLNLSPDMSDRSADPNNSQLGPKFLFEAEQQRKELEKALAESKEKHDIQKAIKESQGGEGEEGVASAKTEEIKDGAEQSNVDKRADVEEDSAEINGVQPVESPPAAEALKSEGAESTRASE